METLTVTPNTKKQAGLLASLFREMGLSYSTQRAIIPEEDRHWPVLEEKLERSREAYAKGETVEISTEGGAEAFWERVRNL